MVILGEVRTGLLQNAGEVQESDYPALLGLLSGELVRMSRRPIVYAVSPHLLTGVDCRLPSRSRARVRGVGTVTSRSSVTGGRVVQTSSHARVVLGEVNHRLPWSHYLARPGTIEVLGKLNEADVADGFLSFAAEEQLDLGSVSDRIMDVVQDCAVLDRRAPFRSRRTQLRWIAERGEPAVHFTLGVDTERTVRLAHRGDFSPAIVDLCEDLALHDWLLTTLLDVVERAGIGVAPAGRVSARLSPAVDALLHLWMPGARTDPSLAQHWAGLERAPGFTRQWQSLVQRVRDQVAVNTLSLLRGETGG